MALVTIGAILAEGLPSKLKTKIKFGASGYVPSKRKIVGLKSIPMRGRSLAIQFSLTKPAQTQVEILSLTGRKVVILEVGRSRLTGQQQIVWQGRGKDGEMLPASAYLVRVIAIDEEERQVQATAVARQAGK